MATSANRERRVRAFAWAAVLLLSMGVALGDLYPEDFGDTANVYFAWAAMAFRMLHVQVALVLAYVALRTWRELRSRWLMACALGLALELLVFEGPVWRPDMGPWSRGPLRVVSANLLMANRLTAPIRAELVEAEADLVCLQEYTSEWDRVLRPALEPRLPHREAVVRDDSFGMAVYSRHRIVGTPDLKVRVGDWGLPQFRLVLRVGEHDVAVYQVHLVPPRTAEYVAQHRNQIRDLCALLREERSPTMVVGDFNFTSHSAQAQWLTRVGLVDAYQAAGVGLSMTWPVVSFLRYLPGLQLDHIFLSHGLIPRRAWTGVGLGSDHRPVCADVDLLVAPRGGRVPER